MLGAVTQPHRTGPRGKGHPAPLARGTGRTQSKAGSSSSFLETGDWGTAHRAKEISFTATRSSAPPAADAFIEYACQLRGSKSYRTIWRWVLPGSDYMFYILQYAPLKLPVTWATLGFLTNTKHSVGYQRGPGLRKER
jgi:hypothetical protein